MRIKEESLQKATEMNEKIKAKEDDIRALQNDLESLQRRVEAKKDEITETEAEKTKLMQSPDYKSESEILKMTQDLLEIKSNGTLHESIEPSAPPAPEDETSLCSICFEKPHNQVFSCIQCDYWVCDGCKTQLQTCPQCRIELAQNPMRRNRAVERILNV